MSSTTGVEGSRSPTLAEVIRAAMDCRELEFHTSLPCRVEKIDKAGKFVDVKPLLRRRFVNPDGTEIDESLPVIPRVPIAWPRAGKFFVTFPIKPGDLVEVVITEASRDAFQASGGEETDPDDFRRFDLSDAWAYPGGGHPDSNALKNFDPDDLVIGVDGGVVAHFKESGEIALGSKTPADNLALASLTKAQIDAQRSDEATFRAATFNTHTHISGAPGVPTGPPVPIATAPPAVGDVKSTVVLSD